MNFLVEKGLADWFRVEAGYYLPSRDVNNFIKRCTSYKPELIILKAFDWRHTDKGFDFWSNINKEWQEHVKLHS